MNFHNLLPPAVSNELFRMHLQHPDITLETHTNGKQLALGTDLMATTRIYLDTKYWIYLRDVQRGRSRNPTHQAILAELRRLRSSNTIICPVSYPVFSELLLQTDPDTRTLTAKLIDELGDGTCILPQHDVMSCEIRNFIRKCITPDAKLLPVNKMVWTKVAFICGMLYPTTKSLLSDTMLAMQKALMDVIWTARLESIVSALPIDNSDSGSQREASAAQLTQGNVESNAAGKPYQELLLDEVAGGLDGNQKTMEELVLAISQETGYRGPVPGPKELVESARLFSGMIHSVFKGGKAGTHLPVVHITAALHAALRHQKGRKYKPGDVDDFFHASLALPYFDAFFTEASLCHLVSKPPLELDRLYSCRVIADDAEVLDYLRSLRTPMPAE